MQKQTEPDDYELRDEYDLSEMTVVAKGRYAPRRRAGKNVVVLAQSENPTGSRLANAPVRRDAT
jgi:hypothetical protein